MPEQESQYHPAVEKIVVTSGPDIGRIKDEEAALSIAISENYDKNIVSILGDKAERSGQNGTDALIERNVEHETEVAIAREAATNPQLLHAIAEGAVAEVDGKTHPLYGEHGENTSMHVDIAKKNAVEAVSSYRELRETVNQQQSADEARKQVESMPETE